MAKSRTWFCVHGVWLLTCVSQDLEKGAPEPGVGTETPLARRPCRSGFWKAQGAGPILKVQGGQAARRSSSVLFRGHSAGGARGGGLLCLSCDH